MEIVEAIYRELRPGGFVLLVLLGVGTLGWTRVFWWLFHGRSCSDTDRRKLQEWIRTVRNAPERRPPLSERRDSLLQRLLDPVRRETQLNSEAARERLDRAIASFRSEKNGSIRVVRVCAVVLPLIGLLGTLLGIIRSFDALALFGTGNIRMLSNGISQALITTQAGLLLAVPLVFMDRYMTAQLQHQTKNLELVAHELLRHRSQISTANASPDRTDSSE